MKSVKEKKMLDPTGIGDVETIAVGVVWLGNGREVEIERKRNSGSGSIQSDHDGERETWRYSDDEVEREEDRGMKE